MSSSIGRIRPAIAFAAWDAMRAAGAAMSNGGVRRDGTQEDLARAGLRQHVRVDPGAGLVTDHV
jgi:hypothetical protein